MAATGTTATTPAPQEAPTGSLGQQAVQYVDSGIVESGDTEGDVSQQPDEQESSAGQQGSANEAPSEEQSAQEVEDLEAFFSEKKPEESDESEDEDYEAGAEQGTEGKPRNRAEKRIRNLAAQLQEAKTQSAQLTQYVQQQQQWAQQATRQFNQQAQMLRQTQLQLAELKGQASMAPKEPESDVDRFRRETAEQARREALEKVSPELKAAMDRVAKLEKMHRDREAQERSIARRQGYNQQVHKALDTHIAPRMDPELFQSLRPHLGGLLVSIAYGQGNTDMDAAAATLNRVINDSARAILRHGRATKGKQVAKSTTAPAKTVPQAGARGEVIPSIEVLHKNGFRSALDYQLKGSPPLR